MNFILDKLASLRAVMSEKGIDAFVDPGSDAHQSEYITDYWKTRQWLSGFTGSSGLVIVTADEAGLWTDGRYFIQAEKELEGSGIKLFKMSGFNLLKQASLWLADKLPSGGKVAFDGRCLSVSDFETTKDILKSKDISFHFNEDIIGNLWQNRPFLPTLPAFTHEIKFAGKTTSEKLATVRKQMKDKHSDLYLVAALDDIAWLTNIRGHDIPKTPVVFSYMLISMDQAWLFIDKDKLQLSDKLEEQGLIVCPYEDIFDHVKKLPDGKTLIYQPARISVRLHAAIPKTVKTKKHHSIITGLKAVKNCTEIENFRNAFIKEGVVMVRFLKWLSERCKINLTEINEIDIQQKLADLRITGEHSLGDSFTTIAAYGENAALVHYSPEQGSCSNLQPEGFLLVDTGGQYLDGTTDITRTIVLGDITDEMRLDYTLVLKGHIALACARFMEGTSGVHLDILARQHIWGAGMDYKHGTGHGLGYCLGVHEGPQNISMHIRNQELQPGMFCTNEPGLYKEGSHGIRTENVLLVKEWAENEHGKFYEFETVSYCPIDTKAIDMSLMTPIEIDFLNDYHKIVYEKLSPHLTQEEQAWLSHASPILKPV